VHKILVFEQKLSERVAAVRVETGGDYYQIRFEIAANIIYRAFKHSLLRLAWK